MAHTQTGKEKQNKLKKSKVLNKNQWKKFESLKGKYKYCNKTKKTYWIKRERVIWKEREKKKQGIKKVNEKKKKNREV
jgi:hypothetical protein